MGFSTGAATPEHPMTDNPETLARYRLPLTRDGVKQAAAFTPMLKAIPRNPLLWIGAAVVGVAGVLAWRNRDKIAAKAQPVIDDARAKGEAMIETARVKGEELIEEAKAKGEEVAAKAARIARVRRTAAAETVPPELH
jgi:polyhydroxyalkanoate synthesis regulator phasin